MEAAAAGKLSMYQLLSLAFFALPTRSAHTHANTHAKSVSECFLVFRSNQNTLDNTDAI